MEDSFETRFQMRTMTSFPMEKLGHYLKLSVLKQMSGLDAVELVKANAGFRSMLLRSPWVVLGEHVYEIHIDRTGTMIIQKFENDDEGLFLKSDFALALTRRIHSCQTLDCAPNAGPGDLVYGHKTILNQLDSVEDLSYCGDNVNGQLVPFLENFHAKVEGIALLDVNFDLLKENEVVGKLFKKFIMNQIHDCKSVEMGGDIPIATSAGFHFYNEAFAETSIKFFQIEICDHIYKEIVESIVSRGIPNSAVAFHVWGDISLQMGNEVENFLSSFPGMLKLNGSILEERIKMGRELLDEAGYLDMFGRALFEGFSVYQRKNDSGKDCVYAISSLDEYNDTDFLTFYIEPPMKMFQE